MIYTYNSLERALVSRINRPRFKELKRCSNFVRLDWSLFCLIKATRYQVEVQARSILINRSAIRQITRSVIRIKNEY